MKPSVRPPLGKPPSAVGGSKITSSTGGLNTGKPVPKVQNKPLSKVEPKSSLQKVSSYGQLKANNGLGSVSSKQIPKAGKIGVGISSSNNPELKQKPTITSSSSIKSGLNSKPPVTNSKGFNSPTTIQKQQPFKVISSKQQIQIPIKKSLGGPGPSARFSQAVEQHLIPCKQCGRTFNEKALVLHQKICKKVFSQKRKQFNSAKQRIISKEQTLIKKKNNLADKAPTHNKNNNLMGSNVPKWKQESLALRAAMKNSRGQALSPTEVFQFNQQSNSHLVPCKFCSKKFNQQAHAKHVVFCEKKAKELNMLNRKKK